MGLQTSRRVKPFPIALLLVFLELDHQLVSSLVLCFGTLPFFTSRSSEMCLA